MSYLSTNGEFVMTEACHKAGPTNNSLIRPVVIGACANAAASAGDEIPYRLGRTFQAADRMRHHALGTASWRSANSFTARPISKASSAPESERQQGANPRDQIRQDRWKALGIPKRHLVVAAKRRHLFQQGEQRSFDTGSNVFHHQRPSGMSPCRSAASRMASACALRPHRRQMRFALKARTMQRRRAVQAG